MIRYVRVPGPLGNAPLMTGLEKSALASRSDLVSKDFLARELSQHPPIVVLHAIETHPVGQLIIDGGELVLRREQPRCGQEPPHKAMDGVDVMGIVQQTPANLCAP